MMPTPPTELYCIDLVIRNCYMNTHTAIKPIARYKYQP